MGGVLAGTNVLPYAQLNDDEVEQWLQRSDFPNVTSISCGTVFQSC